MVAGEVVASWQRKGTKGFLWKVDISKAYDSFNWMLLWSVMRRRGFLEAKMHFIPLPFSLGEWASDGGQDSPSKGDQAGLSASTATTCPSCQCTRYMYEQSLFTRHTEGLPDDKLLKGIPILQYADDTTFFMEGSVEMARNLSKS